MRCDLQASDRSLVRPGGERFASAASASKRPTIIGGAGRIHSPRARDGRWHELLPHRRHLGYHAQCPSPTGPRLVLASTNDKMHQHGRGLPAKYLFNFKHTI